MGFNGTFSTITLQIISFSQKVDISEIVKNVMF